jgi:anti-sigma regulatory factor (Ser/Thr protein kinase)
MTPAQFEKELQRNREAPSIARGSLVDWLGSALAPEELDDAKLLTSELVSNAVLHGRGRIVLRAQLDDDSVVVEVIDEGKGFEREVCRQELDDLHGRGLAIVDAQASRWGIHEGTTHVWFELERPGPRLGAEEKPVF